MYIHDKTGILAEDQEIPCNNIGDLKNILTHVPDSWGIVVSNPRDMAEKYNFTMSDAVRIVSVDTFWRDVLTINFEFLLQDK